MHSKREMLRGMLHFLRTLVAGTAISLTSCGGSTGRRDEGRGSMLLPPEYGTDSVTGIRQWMCDAPRSSSVPRKNLRLLVKGVLTVQ